MWKPLLALSVLVCLPAYRQLVLDRISGKVTDPSGSAVPNAKVEAVNRDTNLKIEASTRENGLYEFPGLPIGSYKVTITHEGFQAKAFTQIQVSANRTTTVDAQLAIGVPATMVEVAATPLRNETDATVGYVLDSSTIEETPLGTGSFTQLALLSPGVNADFLSGPGTNSGLGNQNI